MTVFSKQNIEDLIKNHSCRNLFHPWSDSCPKGNLKMLISAIIGGTKFFSLMYTAQFLFMYKRLTKQDIPEILKSFIRSLMLGGSYAILFTATSCVYSKIYHGMSYNLIRFLTPFMCSVPIFVDHPLRRSIVCRTFISMAVECVLRHLKSRLNNFSSKEVWCFMICNALFMYSIRELKTKRGNAPAMWFFKPPKLKEEGSTFCPHEKSCGEDILQSSLKYFLIGLGFSMVKEISKKPAIVKKPHDFFLAMIKKSSMKIPSFAAAYVGLYKIVSCYLCNRNQKDTTKYALVSGFISGIAYILNPNLTILSSLITILIYLGCSELKDQFGLPNLPYEELGFIIANTFLLSTRVLDAKHCPTSFIKVIDMVTNYRSAQLYKNLENKLKVNSLKILMA